ncbi:MAG: biotin/lipoyl-containing protein [Motiliproteus sp.]
MFLNDDDVNEIIHQLEAGPFEELSLQTSRFKLKLRAKGNGSWTKSIEDFQETNLVNPGQEAADSAKEDTNNTASSAAEKNGHFAVRTPLVGTFYRAPKPGAPDFVEVGSQVNQDTVIGIVETMKLMNSVMAGVKGRVVEICASDAGFVEQGETILFIEEG